MAYTSVPRYDIHKFGEIKPELDRDNWGTWKRKMVATIKERNLYEILDGTDAPPVVATSTTPLDQLQDEWKFRNNSTYNQLLLCISLELLTEIEDTERASEAWKILVDRFESTDPSKVSIVRTRYETYHMTEDQRVMSYITTMKNYRNQLKKMGEIIADSTHAATLLRNVPESWRHISQTIHMITCIPKEIET